MIECQNGSIYTGITTDVDRRWTAHVQGKGAKYTRAFPPKELLASWPIDGNRSTAQSIEKKLKSLPRTEKKRIAASSEDFKLLINSITKKNKKT